MSETSASDVRSHASKMSETIARNNQKQVALGLTADLLNLSKSSHKKRSRSGQEKKKQKKPFNMLNAIDIIVKVCLCLLRLTCAQVRPVHLLYNPTSTMLTAASAYGVQSLFSLY